jgi:predicted nucleotidyltransferase
VLKWPDTKTVRSALDDWLADALAAHPETLKVGYFGSYARGDWGVGSDLDIVAVVATSNKSFTERLPEWDITALPVPTDILVYTQTEWERLPQTNPKFFATLTRETLWIYDRS